VRGLLAGWHCTNTVHRELEGLKRLSAIQR
jgi:hypothetical protein